MMITILQCVCVCVCVCVFINTSILDFSSACIGRHSEAEVGLVSIGSELTCDKQATCQKSNKTNEKRMRFLDFWMQEG